MHPVRDIIYFHPLVLSVREPFKKTYFAVFLYFQRTYLYLVGESIEKLFKSNIGCVCVCVCEAHESKSRYPQRTIRVFLPGLLR